jgi:hypothetical protein
MYRGFDPKKQAEREAWLLDRYGPSMQTSLNRVKAAKKNWTQADYDRSQGEWQDILSDYADAFRANAPVDADAAQTVARRHQDWLAHSWAHPVTADGFRGLARLYSEHPDFMAVFETRAPGLTDYVQAAMRAYAVRELD